MKPSSGNLQQQHHHFKKTTNQTTSHDSSTIPKTTTSSPFRREIPQTPLSARSTSSFSSFSSSSPASAITTPISSLSGNSTRSWVSSSTTNSCSIHTAPNFKIQQQANIYSRNLHHPLSQTSSESGGEIVEDDNDGSRVFQKHENVVVSTTQATESQELDDLWFVDELSDVELDLGEFENEQPIIVENATGGSTTFHSDTVMTVSTSNGASNEEEEEFVLELDDDFEEALLYAEETSAHTDMLMNDGETISKPQWNATFSTSTNIPQPPPPPSYTLTQASEEPIDVADLEEIMWQDETQSENQQLQQAIENAPHNTSFTASDKFSLYYYIPEQIADNYKHTTLYPWQVSLLHDTGVLEGQNLIYSSPTSGGKTLVSEIVMVRRLTQDKSKVIFILPFKAIIEEKVLDLNSKFKDVGWKANPYHSEAVRISEIASFNDDDERVMVCTFERANSILNGLISSGKIDEIGAIIIDELHNITDPNRGYILELILTKIVYLKPKIQIIGMSATLHNVEKLANFLNAHLFVTDYRPVPLSEYLVHNGKVFNVYNKTRGKTTSHEVGRGMNGDTSFVRELPKPTINANMRVIPDRFNIFILSLLDTNFSTLIFCSSKAKCKSYAKFIATQYFQETITEHLQQQRQEAINRLRFSSSGLDPDLKICLEHGVGFHYSSLTMEEKKLVESSFRNGMIKVLLCTTTLATGVNLPARRVIITSLSMGTDVLDMATYKQASGRAGRAGIDVTGESYLFVPSLEQGNKLLSSNFASMISCLNEKQISRALLENISTGTIKTADDIERFLSCTFLSKCKTPHEIQQLSKNARLFLHEKGFIEWVEKTQSFVCTDLGKSTQVSNIGLQEALEYYAAMKQCEQGFYLADDLGILFLLASFVPEGYNNEDRLRDDAERIMEIGHSRKQFRQFIEKQDIGFSQFKEAIAYYMVDKTPLLKLKNYIYALRRTFILFDITRECKIDWISTTYYNSVDHRGIVQSIQRDAAAKASVLSTFSSNISISPIFFDSFRRIKEMLLCGVPQDLVPLVQLPFVGSSTARLLFKEGYKCIRQVAEEDPYIIESIISKHCKNGEQSRAFDIVEGAKEIVKQNVLPRDWIDGREEDPDQNMGKRKKKSRLKAEPKKKKEDAIIEIKSDDDSKLLEFENDWNTCFAFSFCFEFGLQKKKDNPTSFIKNRDQYFVKALAICFNTEHETVLMNNSCETINPNAPSKSYFIHLSKSEKRKDLIKKIFSDGSRKKITYSLKKQQTKLLQCWNFIVRDPILDVMIAEWVQYPDDSENENSLEEIYVKCFPSKQFLFSPSNNDHVIVKTAAQCWPIIALLAVRIHSYNLSGMFEFEMSFVKVLSTMEKNGIRFDYDWIKRNNSIIDARLQEIDSELNSLQVLDGRGIKTCNNDDVAFLLFDKLKMRGTERKTNKEILEKLKKLYPDKAHIMSLISEYRYLLNIKTHHIQNMPNDIKFCANRSEYRIFASQMQTTSATGRLSVKNPNLQNIPKDITIKNPRFGVGGDLNENIVVSIRSGFIPRKGFTMLSVDYKNIELRILAHFSKDPALTEILKNESRDIFEEIARNFWNIPEGEVIPQTYRSLVKQIIYGISYCMGAATLSEKMFNSENEDQLLRPGEDKIEAAERYKQQFFEKYHHLKMFKDKVEATLVEKHWVTTLFHRKRFMHDIASTDSSCRAAARRAALNTVSQGSASDIMKIVMLGIYNFMRHFNRKEMRAYMLVQIHDELLFEVKEESLKIFTWCVKSIMETTCKLRVPLGVKCQIGDSWGTLKDFQVDVRTISQEEKQELAKLEESLGIGWAKRLHIRELGLLPHHEELPEDNEDQDRNDDDEEAWQVDSPSN
ncbi:hypothetical protein C9374_011501 [Naegleria lovaniensis]|uniref:DNA-directed DNA polymerase n=1 Tax=Naegleria lovaniensis TaxID=51637 RepID=A0AA88H2M4_NAELO|nr:uncharacterized protein C9374_011501 [Naegleria lovaniensis]KAG2392776.1 hypothetical protein C9374_011501 [Naegleria lovaniensis]